MICQFTLLHAAQQLPSYSTTSYQQQLPQLHIHNHIQNNSSTNNTNTHTDSEAATVQQTPIEKCLSHSGKQLAECMECLASEDFYKALETMNVRQRRHYLDQLTMTAVKQLHFECPAETWLFLQKIDPECIATIEKTIHTHNKEGSSSVWGILGATIICVIAAAGGCGS